MQDILPSSFVIPSEGGLHKDKTCGRGNGVVDGPRACQPLHMEARNPVHGRSFVDLTSPHRSAGRLFSHGGASKALTGGFGGFAGLFAWWQQPLCAAPLWVCYPPLIALGITCTEDIGEGWGFGFLVSFKKPLTRAPGGRVQATRFSLRMRSCLPCATCRAAPRLRTAAS